MTFVFYIQCTCHGLDGLGSISSTGNNFFLSIAVRPALESTHHVPIVTGSGDLPGVKLPRNETNDSTPSSADVKNYGDTCTPTHFCML
jgi:hypothetical protein